MKIVNRKFSGGNIDFLQDYYHTLKTLSEKESYDAIISFETLEHLPRTSDFLSNCYRNLVDKGRLIISTPNQLVSSPETLNWEYHEKKYTTAEFKKLLHSAGFKNIQLFGQ